MCWFLVPGLKGKRKKQIGDRPTASPSTRKKKDGYPHDFFASTTRGGGGVGRSEGVGRPSKLTPVRLGKRKT